MMRPHYAVTYDWIDLLLFTGGFAGGVVLATWLSQHGPVYLNPKFVGVGALALPGIRRAITGGPPALEARKGFLPSLLSMVAIFAAFTAAVALWVASVSASRYLLEPVPSRENPFEAQGFSAEDYLDDAMRAENYEQAMETYAAHREETRKTGSVAFTLGIGLALLGVGITKWRLIPLETTP